MVDQMKLRSKKNYFSVILLPMTFISDKFIAWYMLI